MSSEIQVFVIPSPASDDDIHSYKQIRLATLKTNPEAFGSKYEDQLAFTHEDWRARIDANARTTLFATAGPTTQSAASLAEVDSDLGIIQNDGIWIGTLSVIAQVTLDAVPSGHPLPPRIIEATSNGDLDIYMLVGMWVHPDFRRRGVGRRLIQKALELLKNASLNSRERTTSSPEDGQNGGGMRDSKKLKSNVLLLGFYDHNDAARKLYENVGFIQEAPGEGTAKGLSWMSIPFAIVDSR
ncbi:hypothetical protein B0H34DRAFT_795525 [Crassisporium funariophilum]|nr:hypothetical protein B0H34DRAFT_795525 [Crassisporium funariophilum]